MKEIRFSYFANLLTVANLASCIQYYCNCNRKAMSHIFILFFKKQGPSIYPTFTQNAKYIEPPLNVELEIFQSLLQSLKIQFYTLKLIHI